MSTSRICCLREKALSVQQMSTWIVSKFLTWSCLLFILPVVLIEFGLMIWPYNLALD
jgi:hypothetical protein